MAEIAINLDELKHGLPGISPSMSTAHLEACLVCFDRYKHPSGIQLQTNLALKSPVFATTEFSLKFNTGIDNRILRTWNDSVEATEFGAGAIAFLVIQELTDYTVIKRSRRGTGFDYWLGYKENNPTLPFQEKARLEISGILEANRDSIIQSRMREKLSQTDASDNLKLPAYVIVVEFSRPIVYVAEKS